ncbi:hypothetical protein DUI87_14901 [Hirundo rustica rustica]|uniref:Uncharacterized protein n=1 Tax=Hirundo rustica rustica TaxID=333673 RepID=A0A3M0K641_HIRRU|nr:hypothetical protein DUI87_14901 [Hirundo rustica rustica]
MLAHTKLPHRAISTGSEMTSENRKELHNPGGEKIGLSFNGHIFHLSVVQIRLSVSSGDLTSRSAGTRVWNLFLWEDYLDLVREVATSLSTWVSYEFF